MTTRGDAAAADADRASPSSSSSSMATATATDPFAILGVDRATANASIARASFRALARRAHPDKGGSATAFDALRVALDRALEEIEIARGGGGGGDGDGGARRYDWRAGKATRRDAEASARRETTRPTRTPIPPSQRSPQTAAAAFEAPPRVRPSARHVSSHAVVSVACGSASAGGTRGAGLVAAASLAGGVVLWDPATGKILDVNDGAFASEKDVSEKESDKDVSEKDSPPANDEETRGPSTNRVASDVWFSDGGDVLACAFADGGVRVFDVGGGGGGGGGSNSTGSKNLNLNLNLNRHTDLKGHAERVTSLCFARGDAIVVTASADRTAKAWRVRDDATGRLVAAAATRPFLDMNRHAAALTCVTPCGYGPISGQHIITCDARGGWRVWSLVTGKCVKKTTWGGDRGADGITKCVALPSKPTSSKQQQTKRTDDERYDEGDDDDDAVVRFATAHYYVDEDASRILVWEVSLGESPSPSRRVCPAHWSPYDRVRVVNADP